MVENNLANIRIYILHPIKTERFFLFFILMGWVLFCYDNLLCDVISLINQVYKVNSIPVIL